MIIYLKKMKHFSYITGNNSRAWCNSEGDLYNVN